MTPWGGLAIVGAGLAAGTVNTIVGSGSLITFPTLLGLGYPAVLANVTNTVGLVPGSVSGAIGYRRELRGLERRTFWLSLIGAAGGLTGAVLLLALPGSVFRQVVPYLILLACALIAVQPWLTRRLANRPRGRGHLVVLGVGAYLTAVYGGYFGAAQGVILIALYAIMLPGTLQQHNAVKNVASAVVNAVAAVVFIAATHVAWGAAGLLALGAVAGGQLGARIGRRLPSAVLRTAILIVGTVVGIELAIRS